MAYSGKTIVILEGCHIRTCGEIERRMTDREFKAREALYKREQTATPKAAVDPKKVKARDEARKAKERQREQLLIDAAHKIAPPGTPISQGQLVAATGLSKFLVNSTVADLRIRVDWLWPPMPAGAPRRKAG